MLQLLQRNITFWVWATTEHLDQYSGRSKEAQRLQPCVKGASAQDCSNSIANVLELLQSFTKPLIWPLYQNESQHLYVPFLPYLVSPQLLPLANHCCHFHITHLSHTRHGEDGNWDAEMELLKHKNKWWYLNHIGNIEYVPITTHLICFQISKCSEQTPCRPPMGLRYGVVLWVQRVIYVLS